MVPDYWIKTWLGLIYLKLLKKGCNLTCQVTAGWFVFNLMVPWRRRRWVSRRYQCSFCTAGCCRPRSSAVLSNCCLDFTEINPVLKGANLLWRTYYRFFFLFSPVCYNYLIIARFLCNGSGDKALVTEFLLSVCPAPQQSLNDLVYKLFFSFLNLAGMVYIQLCSVVWKLQW